MPFSRKNLSHLRAQIKRQASKAARSRLEKRSSVATGSSPSNPEAGPCSAGPSGGGPGQDPAWFAQSLDFNNSRQTSDSPREAGIASSSDSPHGYQINTTTTSSPPGTAATLAGCHTDPNATNTTHTSHTNNPNSTYNHNNNINSNNNNTTGANLSSPNISNTHHSDSAAASGSGGTKHGFGSHLLPGSHNNHPCIGVSVHQKNFKQKLIALIKKFRTDRNEFDSEEQYREALERELMKAAAGRGTKAIEELLKEDIDVEAESGSETEDWDNISESSTPKPSLRPFFSSTTLDKI